LNQEPFERVIEAERSLFFIDWDGLLHYRDLLFLLVRRDFVTRYKQTVLGSLWYIIQPLTLTFVFVIVFSRGIRIPTEGVPPSLFYLSGIIFWNFFSKSLNATAQTLMMNSALFSKVYFPRLIVPLSSILSNVLTFLINCGIFACFYVLYLSFSAYGHDTHPTIWMIAIPFLLLQTGAFAFGLGLLISAFSAKYRDSIYMMDFLTQLWMYLTPVIYPIAVIPQPYRTLLILNPMTFLMELFRHATLGTGSLSFESWLVSFFATVLAFLLGLVVFSRVEQTFVDYV
jgi:lipopolysaccharide transport system permease protein